MTTKYDHVDFTRTFSNGRRTHPMHNYSATPSVRPGPFDLPKEKMTVTHTPLQQACAERKAERKEDVITSAATHLQRALTPTGMNDRKSMQYIRTHLIPAALKNYKALHPAARLEPITAKDAVHIASVTRLTAKEVYDIAKKLGK